MNSRQHLLTIKGPVSIEEFKLVLPHEHIFTDLRGPKHPEYAKADAEHVVSVMKPYLQSAYDAGVTAIMECSTVGVGRNMDVLEAVAKDTPIHIIAPTGVYQDDMMPLSYRQYDQAQLSEIFIKELIEGIEDTKIRAGFIKIAMSNDGPTTLEERNLRAAANASKKTGAVIASHSIGGKVAFSQINILENLGINPDRFVWVHANSETNQNLHLEAARRGVYVEFDAIGAPWEATASQIDSTLNLIEAGCAERILLSHDAGWYTPAQSSGKPEEFGIRGYTSLVEEFIPSLVDRGVSQELIHMLTVTNPLRAFAM